MAEVQDEVDAVMSERVNFTSKYGMAAATSHGGMLMPNGTQMHVSERQPSSSLSRNQTQR